MAQSLAQAWEWEEDSVSNHSNELFRVQHKAAPKVLQDCGFCDYFCCN